MNFDDATALVTVGTIRIIGPRLSLLKCTLGRTCELAVEGQGLGTFGEHGMIRISGNTTECGDEHVAQGIVATGVQNVSEIYQSR